MERVLRLLEYDRVLEGVAGLATGEAGRERVRALRPERRLAAARASLSHTVEMARFLERAGGWLPPAIPPAAEPLRRLSVEGSVLGEEGLVAVARLLEAARDARRELPGPRDADGFPYLVSVVERLPRLPELRDRLRASFDEGGTVADGASSRLARLRGELRRARTELVNLLERYAAGLRDRVRLPEASVTVRAGRYCIPIRREGRSDVGGIVHDESSTGQTLFVEPPPAVEPMNRIRELEAEERREVRRILRELTEAARPAEPELSAGLSALVELDALQARARWSLRHGGTAPVLTEPGEEGGHRVVRGVHPLLLEGEGEAVPFDLALEPGERVLLVSGPNAGGKTVLLKSIGLLSVLAQSGLVPPVGPGTRLPVFERVFAVIGDEQSIDASLSTFTARMGRLTRVLERADRRSLVLLDEVGGHTDPEEGGALAAAILLRLAELAGLTVASTHLGALKTLAGRNPAVVNASLRFDTRRLRPTYRLERDRPGRSYALEIASRTGIPPELIRRAREGMPEDALRLERVLAELERREEALAREDERLRVERERLEGTATELRRRAEALGRRASELERRERALEREGRARAERYLLEARAEVEEAIRRLGADAGGRETGEGIGEEAASAARARVERAIRESRQAASAAATSPAEAPPPELEEGDEVRIRGLGRPGRVREIREDRVVVEAGGVRLSLPAGELEPFRGDGTDGDGTEGEGLEREGADGRERGSAREGRREVREAARREAPSGGGVSLPHLEVESEVHLRGLRVDEVEAALLPRLDAAVVADLPRLRIVHGKGTGALRREVHRLLEADPRVASFRGGGPGEGGSGVTVAEFGR